MALVRRRLPRRETNWALLVAVPLLLSEHYWERIAFLMAGEAPMATGESSLPFDWLCLQ